MSRHESSPLNPSVEKRGSGDKTVPGWTADQVTPHTLREYLLSLAGFEGGWGYQVGQALHLEPTCLALLALAEDPHYAPVIQRSVLALEQHRLPDGSYRLRRGRPQAVWMTALVLFTRRVLQHDKSQLEKSINHLLGVQGRVVKTDAELANIHDIDLSLVGWPWAEANFSWVEPTCWACIALRAVGLGHHPRVREGLKLLLDRAFDSGGVNLGSRMVLGKPTEPIPSNTAQMLIALQGVDNEPRIDAAVGYLRLQAAKSTDVEHLAWAKLALAIHDADRATRDLLPVIDERLRGCLLEDLHRRDGLAAGPMRIALSALALDTQRRHPFRLPNDGAIPAKSDDARPLMDLTAPPDTSDTRSLGERLKSRFRGWLISRVTGKFRPLPPTSAVHIAKAETYDAPLVDILLQQYGHFRDAVPIRGKRVVLKPNLVEYHRDKVINTDPRVIEGVIELCRREGAAEITVAEGPGHWRNVPFLVKESGLAEVLTRYGVRFVDLNHDEPVKLLNLGRLTGLDYLYLARTVVQAEVLISLPKLKTHHWAGATLSLKNLFGTLPGICYGWPKNELHWRGIPNSIVDIACTNCPHLAIVDGIVGMEGDGPLNGRAKPVGVLVMGADLVAVDATCCRIMQIPPERLPTLVLAAIKRLGQMQENLIPQLGEPISSVSTPFEWPPQVERYLLSEDDARKVKV